MAETYANMQLRSQTYFSGAQVCHVLQEILDHDSFETFFKVFFSLLINDRVEFDEIKFVNVIMMRDQIKSKICYTGSSNLEYHFRQISSAYLMAG